MDKSLSIIENKGTPKGIYPDVLSDEEIREEIREPIENAIYATNRFLTTEATDLAEGIIQYIKDAGYSIVRTER